MHPMRTEVTTRPLTLCDADLLRTATLTNMNWTGEERFTYRDIDTIPGLRHYQELRPARGDFGVVADRQDLVVGVIWLLLLGGDEPGYGFVAHGVPELSICVFSGHRRQGIGRLLMKEALDEARRRGHLRVSLSVEEDNPAVNLYRAMGFEAVPDAAGGTYSVDL